jgi:hypothetical protein
MLMPGFRSYSLLQFAVLSAKNDYRRAAWDLSQIGGEWSGFKSDHICRITLQIWDFPVNSWLSCIVCQLIFVGESQESYSHQVFSSTASENVCFPISTFIGTCLICFEWVCPSKTMIWWQIVRSYLIIPIQKSNHWSAESQIPIFHLMIEGENPFYLFQLNELLSLWDRIIAANHENVPYGFADSLRNSGLRGLSSDGCHMSCDDQKASRAKCSRSLLTILQAQETRKTAIFEKEVMLETVWVLQIVHGLMIMRRTQSCSAIQAICRPFLCSKWSYNNSNASSQSEYSSRAFTILFGECDQAIYWIVWLCRQPLYRWQMFTYRTFQCQVMFFVAILSVATWKYCDSSFYWQNAIKYQPRIRDTNIIRITTSKAVCWMLLGKIITRKAIYDS